MATLEVDDTSPTIFYTPNGNNFSSPNVNAGWNPYYNVSGFFTAPGEIGNGTSYHITSLNGASLTIQWRGTGIQLFGNTTNAACNITLDGKPQPQTADPSNNVLASMQSLSDTPHNITLTAITGTTQNPQGSSMVVFDKAEISTSSAAFSPQTIDDKTIPFRGRWSVLNENGVTFHQSALMGDSGQAEFNGTSITLRGLTSPDSGNYNVTLDNQTTAFSATSCFRFDDSLLFIATGLDPQIMHQVNVVNAGGGLLSLRADGFRINSPDLPTPIPSSSPAPAAELTSAPAAPMTNFPKGSIAAFVLAGFLACFIFSGAIFYCLFYRPRQRRRKQEKLECQRKDHEAGLILNIGPGISQDPQIIVDGGPGQRNSGKTGFVRWKREVEGGFGSLSLKGLGLAFRHSDSIRTEPYVEENDEKNVSDGPLSTKSSKTTTSSKRERVKRKGKKRQTAQLSWSPSFTLDLPLRGRSNSDARSNSSRNQAPKVPPTPSSGFTSLSYISIPAAIASRYRLASNNNSRSNTNTNSNSNSTPQSIPQSVSQSAQTPPASKHRAAHGSRGFLLDYADPAPTSETTATDNGHDPPQSISRPSSKDYWASTADGGDESSFLGPTSTQDAVRSLGPRTSEALAKIDKSTLLASAKPRPLPDIPKQLPASPRTSSDRIQAPDISTSQGLWAQTTPPHAGGSPILTVGDTSPFRVDFDASLLPQRHSGTVAIGAAAERLARLSGISHVRFESTDTSSAEGSRNGGMESMEYKPRTSISGEKSRSEAEKPVESKPRTSITRGPRSSLPRIPRSSFRLTPLTLPPPTADSDSGSTSYVDFDTPDPSTRGHPEHGSSSSEDARAPGPSRTVHSTRQRKSMSMLESAHSDAHSIPPARPLPSDIPPFTVSIHPPTRRPTEEGSEHTRLRQSLPPQVKHKRSRLHIHPLSPSDLASNTSPTDSVPVSIRSDLYFKHSDSEEAGESNETHESAPHRPPHPPLPDFEGGDPNSSSPTVHSYLVQRVLGTHTPSPRTPGMGSGHKRTGSGGWTRPGGENN